MCVARGGSQYITGLIIACDAPRVCTSVMISTHARRTCIPGLFDKRQRILKKVTSSNLGDALLGTERVFSALPAPLAQ